MRGVAPAARRPKSRFGSTLERLSYIRIWYFEKETRDLVRISQSELIESFVDVFSDYESGVALSLLCEISENVLPEREALDAPFRLLLLVARKIKQTRKPEVPLAYFCLWSAKLAGWLPRLDMCVNCGVPLGVAPGYTAPLAEGLTCAKCRVGGARQVPAAVLELGRLLQGEKLEKLVERSVSPLVARELTAVLLDWIEFHVEKRLVSRRIWEQKI
jgi:DNA repair protein RecO (recombination protein O)